MRDTKAQQSQVSSGNEFFNWVVFASVLLFAINNWWLKYEFHNWFTGKLSDVLFCFFFPLYCSAIFALLTRWKKRIRVWVGAMITMVSFIAVKTIPPLSFWLDGLLSNVSQAVVGVDSHNIVDATDIVAIPFVLCSVWFSMWEDSTHENRHI